MCFLCENIHFTLKKGELVLTLTISGIFHCICLHIFIKEISESLIRIKNGPLLQRIFNSQWILEFTNIRILLVLFIQGSDHRLKHEVNQFRNGIALKIEHKYVDITVEQVARKLDRVAYKGVFINYHQGATNKC